MISYVTVLSVAYESGKVPPGPNKLVGNTFIEIRFYFNDGLYTNIAFMQTNRGYTTIFKN